MVSLSADLEVVAERLAEHGGRGLVITLRSLQERVAQLRLKPHRLDACGCRAERWPTSASAQRLAYVVAGVGLGSELLDQLVGNRDAARGLPICLLRHSQPPGRSSWYLSRIFMASITSLSACPRRQWDRSPPTRACSGGWD